MGIKGLLPELAPIQQQRRLSDYKGKTIAVDAYVWLHKGIYTCAIDLAQGKPTTKYIDYSMSNLRLLKHFGITPYVVFDGGPLPAKKLTESERKARREVYRQEGLRLLKAKNIEESLKACVKSIDVSPQMAYQLIKALKVEGIQYVVAPYEADAQLAYLQRIGLVDAVITEDSDLLVFGCTEVLYKFCPKNQTVMSISTKDFGSIRKPSSGKKKRGFTLSGLTDAQFRTMAIMSGCDYLPNIAGVGLRTACGLVHDHKTIKHIIQHMRLEGRHKRIPLDYLDSFEKAEKTFLHQRVFCPLDQQLVHLTPIVEEEWTDELDAHVGRHLDKATARAIAAGDVDPTTLEPMTDIAPTFLSERPLQTSTANNLSASAGPGAKGKGKIPQSRAGPSSGGIYSFFGPNPVIPRSTPQQTASIQRRRSLSPAKPRPSAPLAGRASGKRTFADAADEDRAAAAKKQRQASTPTTMAQSKFFQSREASLGIGASGMHRRHSEGTVGTTLRDPSEDKENIRLGGGKDISDDEALSDDSAKARVDDDDMDLDVDTSVVAQLDGYISPKRYEDEDDAQDLSSPVRPELDDSPTHERSKGKQRASASDIDSDHDDPTHDDFLSSPVSTKKRTPRFVKPPGHSRPAVQETPTRTKSTGPMLDAIIYIHLPNTSSTSKEPCRGVDLQSSLHANDEDDQETGVNQVPASTRLTNRRTSLKLTAALSCNPLRNTPSLTSINLNDRSTSSSPITTPGQQVPLGRTAACIQQQQQNPEPIYVRDSSDEEIDDESPEEIVKSKSAAISEAWREKFTYTGTGSTFKTPTARARGAANPNPNTPLSASVGMGRQNRATDMQRRVVSSGPGVISAPGKMRRSETNVTPEGVFALMGSRADGTPLSGAAAASRIKKNAKALFQDPWTSASVRSGRPSNQKPENYVPLDDEISMYEPNDEKVQLAKAKQMQLSQFR